MSDDPRFSDYWAAIRHDLNKQTVDAVIRKADSEVAVVQARLDEAEARVDQLTDERDAAVVARDEFEAAYVTTMDTLTKRTEAHGRLAKSNDELRATVERMRALFSGGPDTPCRTVWHEVNPGNDHFCTSVEFVEVPMADILTALDGPK